ncbi:MAG: hypothetical protein KDB22_11070 [Planctomycetales bacterium]|nr:hypothetical protein [Planctomycetales bacterium]
MVGQSWRSFTGQQYGEVMASVLRTTSGRAPELLGRALNRMPKQTLLQAKRLLAERVSSDVFESNRRRELSFEISSRVLQSSRTMQTHNFVSATAKDLQFMAELYDQFFFSGLCLPIARHYGLQFRWSKRMTSAGGKTVRIIHTDHSTRKQSTRYEIVLSATLLFQTFSDLQRPIRVTGVLCTNRLQAMQRIMEHELIHLVEMLVWDDSCCAAARFQSIARRLFGHTEHKHDLITQQERAASKFNVRVGSLVKFQHDGQAYVGTVNRITRRATVLVVHPTGQLYDDGQRYRKFYVPVSLLRPAR